MTTKIKSKIVNWDIVKEVKEGEEVQLVKLKERPVYLPGRTYRLKTQVYKHAFYVTINQLEGSPFEIFINSQNNDAKMWMDSNTFSWSAVFRENDNIDFLITRMLKVVDPRGGHSAHETFHGSIVAEIGYILQCERDAVPLRKSERVEKRKPLTQDSNYLDTKCPECGEARMRMVDGCATCDCGYSKCG